MRKIKALAIALALGAIILPTHTLVGDDCYTQGPGDDFCVSAEGHVYYFGYRP